MFTVKKLVFILIFLSFASFSAPKKTEEKKYTEEEFRKKVNEELSVKLKKLSKGRVLSFSKELLGKEEKLEIKALELTKKEEQISKIELDLNKKIKLFNGSQEKFLSCVNEVEKKEKKRIDHMVAVIAGMKPKNAAEVLSVQEAKISVQILGQLDPVKVSKIFNLMKKEISARLQKQYLTMKR